MLYTQEELKQKTLNGQIPDESVYHRIIDLLFSVQGGQLSIATVQETLAGLLNDKAVTPLGLKSYIDIIKGNVPSAGDTLEKLYNAISGKLDSSYALTNLLYQDNDISSLYARGRRLFEDEFFLLGQNGIVPFNNLGNGNVTINRIVDFFAPNESKKVLEISYNGNGIFPSDSIGGFSQQFAGVKGNTFYHVFKAKIPIGYRLRSAFSSTSTLNFTSFITPPFGTGDWNTYVVRCKNGSKTLVNSNYGHIYVVPDDANTVVSYPFVWHLSSATVYRQGAYDKNVPILQGWAGFNSDGNSVGSIPIAYTYPNSSPLSGQFDLLHGVFLSNYRTNISINLSLGTSSIVAVGIENVAPSDGITRFKAVDVQTNNLVLLDSNHYVGLEIYSL